MPCPLAAIYAGVSGPSQLLPWLPAPPVLYLSTRDRWPLPFVTASLSMGGPPSVVPGVEVVVELDLPAGVSWLEVGAKVAVE